MLDLELEIKKKEMNIKELEERKMEIELRISMANEADTLKIINVISSGLS